MRLRSIFTCVIGNALEFYDSALVIVYATYLSQYFLPPTQTYLHTIYSGLGLFALGVLIRPLGALLFGYIGDKHGRKVALSLSMIMMAIPSLLLVLSPGYASIGISASIILVIARIIQGVCTGGEYNGAAIYTLEHNTQRQGFISGIMTASSVFGFSLAALVQITLKYSLASDELSWRCAFLIGALIALFGIYMRLKLMESPAFLEKKQHVSKGKVNTLPLLLTFLVAGQTSLLGYLLLAIAPQMIKLKNTNIAGIIFHLNLAGSFIFGVSCILFGHAFDRFKIKNTSQYIQLVSVLNLGILPMALYAYKYGSVHTVYLIHTLLAVLCGLQGSIQHLYFQQLFDTQNRYRCISFSFTLGTGILAVLTPLWCFQKHQAWLVPVIYTSLTGFLTYYTDKKRLLDNEILNTSHVE